MVSCGSLLAPPSSTSGMHVHAKRALAGSTPHTNHCDIIHKQRHHHAGRPHVCVLACLLSRLGPQQPQQQQAPRQPVQHATPGSRPSHLQQQYTPHLCRPQQAQTTAAAAAAAPLRQPRQRACRCWNACSSCSGCLCRPAHMQGVVGQASSGPHPGVAAAAPSWRPSPLGTGVPARRPGSHRRPGHGAAPCGAPWVRQPAPT